MLNYIRENDIIVVLELDRLGRSNKEITRIMNSRQRATFEILNLPSLKGKQDDNLKRLLNNLIIELFKYTAENKRKQKRVTYEKIVEMVGEGSTYN